MVLLFRNAIALLQFCTIIMAKSNERRVAKELFLQGKYQNEIARLVNVQEKTIGDWVKKYGWIEERDARFNSSKTQIKALKDLIGKLTEQRLKLVREMEEATNDADNARLNDLQKKANTIADEVAKYNKALISLDKNNRISLAVYIDVMDGLFKAIQEYDSKIYLQLLDFQEQHLSDISKKIG
jgi:uncharacterized protein YjcR